MYAIAKAGGHQKKVEVSDATPVNRLDAKKNDTAEFPVSFAVGGDKVTPAAAGLAKVSVKAEVVNNEAKGPEASTRRYKNRIGVTRHRGYRQKLTIVKITAIT